MPILENLQRTTVVEQPVSIEVGGVQLKGDLRIPAEAFGLVLLAAGAETGWRSSGSRLVADELEKQGLAVLSFPLLTSDETDDVLRTDLVRFSGRLLGAADWAGRQSELRDLPLAVFGSGAAAAPALVAASERSRSLAALVCHGGRVDLAGGALANVRAPVLLLVGAADAQLVQAHESALIRLGSSRKELVMIPSASARLGDRAELETVADLATDWLSAYLVQMS